MEHSTHRILWRKRTLACGLSAAVLLLVGCSMTMTVGRWPKSDDAAGSGNTAAKHNYVDAPNTPVPVAAANNAGASHQGAVNSMGEFSQRSASLNPSAADAAFQRHTVPGAGRDADICLDPTAHWMLFSSTRDSDHAALYLQRADAPSVTQLTSGAGGDDVQGVFSADGKHIAFCSNRSGNWHLYAIDADGRNPTQLTDGLAAELHPTFSPDGTRLAYCSRGADGAWELWMLDLRSGATTDLGPGLFPAWSPDKTGDHIAFQKAHAHGSRWFSIWTLDIIDGRSCHVTEVAVSPNSALVTPCWNADSSRLGFAAIVEASDPKAKTAVQQDIWIINADGTGRQRLTDGAGTSVSPFWAGDGRVYFISDRGGRESVWSAPVANADKTVTTKQSDKDQTAGAADAQQGMVP